MSAKQEYHKAYVNVIVEHQLDGQKTPLQIIFEDGRKFNIDRVVERRRAAATKVLVVFIRLLLEDKSVTFMKTTAYGLSRP